MPRDRDLSNAQLSGLDPGWFQHEILERTKWCDFPALVTTWTDGENGGWFRATQIESGFWGFFYRPILEPRELDGDLALGDSTVRFVDQPPVEHPARTCRTSSCRRRRP